MVFYIMLFINFYLQNSIWYTRCKFQIPDEIVLFSSHANVGQIHRRPPLWMLCKNIKNDINHIRAKHIIYSVL